MIDTKTKTGKDNPMKGYDPTDRDFQRTEQDIDNVSKSEKDALQEKAKEANATSGEEKK